VVTRSKPVPEKVCADAVSKLTRPVEPAVTKRSRAAVIEPAWWSEPTNVEAGNACAISRVEAP